jgi:hypothetical protein
MHLFSSFNLLLAQESGFSSRFFLQFHSISIRVHPVHCFESETMGLSVISRMEDFVGFLDLGLFLVNCSSVIIKDSEVLRSELVSVFNLTCQDMPSFS